MKKKGPEWKGSRPVLLASGATFGLEEALHVAQSAEGRADLTRQTILADAVDTAGSGRGGVGRGALLPIRRFLVGAGSAAVGILSKIAQPPASH